VSHATAQLKHGTLVDARDVIRHAGRNCDLWAWSRLGGLRYAVRLRQSIPSSGWMRAAGAGRPKR
jgi:hypothetical protein